MKSILRSSDSESDEWVSVSDLMAGLMLVFLMISVFYMLQIQGITGDYADVKEKLYDALQNEFHDQLDDWGAEITQDLSVRFQEPSILFSSGEASLTPRFEVILNEFFPRYVEVLRDDDFRDHIAEIRIEGHTSSIWNRDSSSGEAITTVQAYFNNMGLSQQRTRRVLEHVYRPYSASKTPAQADWVMTRLTANGLSSSHLILKDDGSENQEASRRVEFRVRTDAEEQMGNISKALNPVSGIETGQ